MLTVSIRIFSLEPRPLSLSPLITTRSLVPFHSHSKTAIPSASSTHHLHLSRLPPIALELLLKPFGADTGYQMGVQSWESMMSRNRTEEDDEDAYPFPLGESCSPCRPFPCI
jgi:hypothetical protein